MFVLEFTPWLDSNRFDDENRLFQIIVRRVSWSAPRNMIQRGLWSRPVK